MAHTLRKGKVEDIDSVLRLIRELAEFEKSQHEVKNTEEHLVEDCFGKSPVCGFYVALVNEKIVGLALYYTSYSTWVGRCLYLEDIVVAESFRGQGIGTALFDQMIRLAKEGQYKRLEWQVLTWNTKAIDLYKKYNAQLCHEWLPCRLNYDELQKIAVQ